MIQGRRKVLKSEGEDGFCFYFWQNVRVGGRLHPGSDGPAITYAHCLSKPLITHFCVFSSSYITFPGPPERMGTGRLVRPAEPAEGLKNLGGAST